MKPLPCVECGTDEHIDITHPHYVDYRGDPPAPHATGRHAWGKGEADAIAEWNLSVEEDSP